jgi:hypothetical protein
MQLLDRRQPLGVQIRARNYPRFLKLREYPHVVRTPNGRSRSHQY